jgi:hypothetical protein
MAVENIRERVNQTRRHLESLRRETLDWIEIRQRGDKLLQYDTQLTTLKTQLEFLLGKISSELGSVSLAGGSIGAYAALRRIDKRLLWVRRLWSYFQSRFDQRLDSSLAPLLHAADEIVWSCFAQPFRNADGGKAPPAVPLPFLTPSYSPYAIPRDEPPQDLRSDVDAEFLGEMLKQLPIPVTGIPDTAVAEPWSLAYLAHEIGHHVQFDFAGGSLLQTFGDALKVVGGVRWQGWSKELFADFYSLLMLGPWALWALAELVWSDPTTMLDDSNPRYPCPLVRLLLMKVANKLKIDGTAALRGLQKSAVLDGPPAILRGRDLKPVARADLDQVKAVAGAIVSTAYLGRTLTSLCSFSPAEFTKPNGTVPLWGDALRGNGVMVRQGSLESARLVLAGGVAAWATVREIEDDQARDTARVALRRELLDSIVANREDITRAAEEPEEIEVAARNDRLAAILLGDLPGPDL